MAILVQDSFNRVNGALGVADTGQTWQSNNLSNFVISNNRATVSAYDAFNTDFAVIESGRSNVAVSGDLSGTSGSVYSGCPRLHFRVLDYNNFWMVYNTGSSWQLIKVVNGSNIVVSSSSAVAGPSSTNTVNVKVECNGDNITWYLNGTLIATVTDSTFSAATQHGFGTQRVQGLFDNFAVDSLTTGGGTGTTYTGAGTAQGIASPSGLGTLFAVAAGTAQGLADALAHEISVLKALGTAQGMADLSASPTVILVAGGTAGGYSSLLANIDATVYPSSGIADGSSDLSAFDQLFYGWRKIAEPSTLWIDEEESTTVWIIPIMDKGTFH